MYDTKAIEILDGLCITCLIPLSACTLFINLVALVAVCKLRADHHISVLGNLVFCDILLVICQSYTLKAFVTGRVVDAEVEVLCNVSGVIFNTTICVTWWCLTLAFLIKMWHISLSRVSYHVVVATVWLLSILFAAMPLITRKNYFMSWTHAMCVLDDMTLFQISKSTTVYNILYSMVLFVQYILPIVLCVASTIKDLYSGRKRIRSGWSCTVMIFFTYCLFYVLWWVDETDRHYTHTIYPVSTGTIIRRTATLMVLYAKPLVSLLCMYHFMAEFRSAFLQILQLEFNERGALHGGAGPQYERMYTEIGESGFSPGTTM